MENNGFWDEQEEGIKGGTEYAIEKASAENEMRETSAVSEAVRTMVIDSAEGMNSASTLRKELKSKVKDIEGKRLAATRPLDAAKKTIMEWFSPAIDALTAAIKELDTKIIRYDNEVKKKLAEEQAAMNKAAMEKAMQEKAALKEAIAKEDDIFVAQEMKIQEVMICPDIPAYAPPPTTKGISYRTDWYAEIYDASLIPREYLVPDMEKLNGIAKAMKGVANIPGVEFKSKQTVVGR